MLSACSQTIVQKASVQNLQLEPKQETASSRHIGKLLKAEFSLQREGPNKAFDQFYDLAQESRNLGLTKRLTDIAIAAQNNDHIKKSTALWLSVEPNSEQAYSLRMQALVNKNQDNDVASLLIKAIDNQVSLGFLPLYLEDNVRNSDSVNTIKNAIMGLPAEYQHNQHVQLTHAHISLLEGEYKSATRLADQLLTRSDTEKTETLYLVLAFSHKNMGALDEAISTLLRATDELQKSIRLTSPLIDFLVENKQPRKAMDIYKKTSFETTDQLQVGINAMRIFLEYKYPKYALAITMSLPKEQLGLANQIKYLTAISLADLDNTADAIRIMNQVDGNLRSRATRQLVLWLYHENQEGVINDVVLSRTLRKNLPEQAILTGQFHEDRGNIDLSYDLISRSSKALPESNVLRYRKALIAETLGNWQTTEEELKILLEKDADNPQYLNALGYTILTRTDRLDEAMIYIESAYEKAEDDPAIIDSLGWGHFLRNEFEQSSYYLKKAWNILPDAEIAAHYGESLWKQRHYKQATKIWETALETEPNSPLLLKTIKRLSPLLLDQQRNEAQQDDLS